VTDDELKDLDDVSDRLGALYQRFGRLQHKHAIKDDDVTVILDELVALDELVCATSGRVKRSLSS
jgi:hypothetical protein